MRFQTLAVIGLVVACSSCHQFSRPGASSDAMEDSLKTRFYEAFCAEVRSDGDERPCDAYIYAPPTVSVTATGRVSRQTRMPAMLVFIPGIFGECVAPLVTPFSDSYDALAQMGYRTLVVPVDGRSSSEANARQIDAFLRSHATAHDRIMVFGYSKGATDFITALGAYPDAPWVKQTVAFISVAGVIQGTPLADRYVDLYDHLLASVPFPTCAPGIGSALASMTVGVRNSWLATHSLPSHIRYYSIAAQAEEGWINPLLAPFWYQLKIDGMASDGQVTPQATRVPGGQELALLRGDHWSIALPFKSSHSVYPPLFSVNNAFPRRALIKSIVTVIEDDIPSP